MIERLFEAGVDVFRINMSHSSFDLVKKVHAAVRTAEATLRAADRHPVPTCRGPKFRVGNIGGERVTLAEGATFRFDTHGERRRGRARVPAASADLRGGGARATRCCSTTARSA